MFQTFVGIVFGIITSYVFYLIGRTRARISYQTSKLQIIGNINLKLPEDFEVTVAGVRVDSLQKTQFVIWNGGTTTISGDEIVKDDRLRVVFGLSTKILDYNIIGLSREVNKFTVEVNENAEFELLLNFDFLDRKDGVIIEVLHTDSIIDPELKGTVKGLVNGIKNKGRIDYIKTDKRKSIIFWRWGIPLLTGSLVGTILFFLVISLADELKDPQSFNRLATYCGFILGTSFPILLVFNDFQLFKKKFPRSIKEVNQHK